MIPAQAHLDPRFKSFPNLHEDEYESILAVPILARDDKLEGALNVRTREPREFARARDRPAARDRRPRWRSRSSTRSSTRRRSAASHELEALARISEAVSESLYLEESLEAIVKTTMDAVGATGAALVLEDGKIAWPEGRARRTRCGCRCAGSGAQIGELVCDRDTPFTDDERALLASIAHHAAVALEHGRAVMRGVLAQEIHHRVKNNLQTVASLLRLQARATDVDPRKALEDSVNRILAIAAVHEVLTEQRDEEVDLAELLDRLRAMLVQGLGAGKEVEPSLEPVSSRATGPPRSRSSSASCCRTRSSTAATGARRARAAQRRRRARDRRRRRRASTASRAAGPASRSSGRSSATSSAASSRSTRTAGSAPRSSSPPSTAARARSGCPRGRSPRRTSRSPASSSLVVHAHARLAQLSDHRVEVAYAVVEHRRLLARPVRRWTTRRCTTPSGRRSPRRTPGRRSPGRSTPRCSPYRRPELVSGSRARRNTPPIPTDALDGPTRTALRRGDAAGAARPVSAGTSSRAGTRRARGARRGPPARAP